VKQEIEKIDISVKQFTLPHSGFCRLGGNGIDIVRLAKNLRHIEETFVKLGIKQCKNCNKVTDSTLLGIGGICEQCWIEDESVCDYDFSSIPEKEIYRHLRKLPLFSDLEKRDRAILKLNPSHKFNNNPQFELLYSYYLKFSSFFKYVKENERYDWRQDRGVYKETNKKEVLA